MKHVVSLLLPRNPDIAPLPPPSPKASPVFKKRRNTDEKRRNPEGSGRQKSISGSPTAAPQPAGQGGADRPPSLGQGGSAGQGPAPGHGGSADRHGWDHGGSGGQAPAPGPPHPAPPRSPPRAAPVQGDSADRQEDSPAPQDVRPGLGSGAQQGDRNEQEGLDWDGQSSVLKEGLIFRSRDEAKKFMKRYEGREKTKFVTISSNARQVRAEAMVF